MIRQSYTILYLSTDWWGSDARALGQALRNKGHNLVECNYENFYPLTWSSKILRIIRKLTRPLITREYNQQVQRIIRHSSIDFLLVFKGMLLTEDTIKLANDKGIPTFCFYPDVSIGAHGSNISQCIPRYDHIFTTKSFHLKDPALLKLNANWSLVNHGFDPEVHKSITLTEKQISIYGCDLSFIGCWSPKKEHTIECILSNYPSIDLHIWGPTWHLASTDVQRYWKKRAAYGDELNLIYNASKINLGLLSEASADSTEGDQVTARTWQIPASGGFLLHEKTDELTQHFTPQSEVAAFESEEELIQQIRNYLNAEELRTQISSAAHRRCHESDYSYSPATSAILNHFLKYHQ